MDAVAFLRALIRDHNHEMDRRHQNSLSYHTFPSTQPMGATTRVKTHDDEVWEITVKKVN